MMRGLALRLLALGWAFPPWAAPSAAHALDLTQYPEVGAFIGEMSERHGFDAAQLRRLFLAARIRPEIVEAMERPGEARPWYEYKGRFLDEEHVRDGRRYWERHAQALERARESYGVDPEIVVAIIGVETQYGRNRGKYPVVDALATLMLHYPQRSEFFRRELEEFLLLCRENGFDPATLKGSYAGAIGAPQFLPSSYRRYAVDFDADGRRDLLGSPADVIGSVAHFLKAHGWEARAPVTDEVRLEGTLYFWIEKLGTRPALPVSRLIQYGVVPRRPAELERRAALIVLEGEDGPIHRLGYNNFYVITRYNRSALYAMAVYELGELIRKRRAEPS